MCGMVKGMERWVNAERASGRDRTSVTNGGVRAYERSDGMIQITKNVCVYVCKKGKGNKELEGNETRRDERRRE